MSLQMFISFKKTKEIWMNEVTLFVNLNTTLMHERRV